METALQMELEDAQRNLKLANKRYQNATDELEKIPYEEFERREEKQRERGAALGEMSQLQNQIISLERFLRVVKRNKKTA
jgi:hypothetical protein